MGNRSNNLYLAYELNSTKKAHLVNRQGRQFWLDAHFG
ncbi:Uncharacterised protein [Sphingobacterium multivorum]|nr:Uncharacterised protein [Sphingobacterium multivorum]